MRDSHLIPAEQSRPDEHRVLITGIGMVTPLGSNWTDTWDAIGAGASAIAPATRFADAGGGESLAAEIHDFDPRPHFSAPKALKLTDLKTRLAVAASSMAVDDAGLGDGPQDRDRLEVVIGCTSSDIQVGELARAIAGPGQERCAEDIVDFAHRVTGGMNPLWLLINLPNMVSAQVGIQLGTTAPNRTLMTDWLAGSQALGEACLAIRHGDAELVLAGGADTGVLPFYAGCYEQHAKGESQSFVFGEGAAMMVLESEESVARRGGRALGEICAYADRTLQSGETLGISALSGALEDVLADTGWIGDEVDLVCRSFPAGTRGSHGEQEEEAIERLYGSVSSPQRLCEFRSQLGHSLAASGAIDAALTLSRLREKGPGSRAICWSLGLLGQATVLALTSTGNPR